MTTNFQTLTLLLAVCGLAGCATPPTNELSDPEPIIRLAATLISPTDVTLDWKGMAKDAAGVIVEFATDPNGEYTIIEFLQPNRTRFVHSALIPETTFYYRVRAYYGPASNLVEVTLPEPPPEEDIDKDNHAWAYPQTLAEGLEVAKQPIRSANSAGSVPTDLKATVMHSSGIRFTWTDHASDEEGYLLEIKPEGSLEFSVAAVLDPNINSLGLITMPNEKKASFRVRAFYYGKPSNIVHETTGQGPP